MSTLQEHLEDAYDIDIEEQEAIRMMEAGQATFHPDAAPQADRFVIDDEDKATWALRKLARIEAELRAAEEQADLERSRIATWLVEVSGPIDRQREFFLGLLREYHEQTLAADPSKKTIKLPAGTLKSKAGQNKWTVEADAFLEWFDNDTVVPAEHPELVRVKREPALSAIKQVFEPRDDRAVYPNTGEIVAGVTVEPGQRTFTVEVAE